jgi:hypothetical protein
MEPIQTVFLVLLVAVFVVYRQMRTRPTASRGVLYTSAIMVVVGVAGGGLIDGRHLTISLALLVVEVVAALALGAVRAATVRVWRDASGVAWSKATGWTALAWLASVAVRVGMYFASVALGLTVSTTSILLFMGLTIGAQALLVDRRGRALSGTARRADTVLG